MGNALGRLLAFAGMDKIKVTDKLDTVREHFSPKIIAELIARTLRLARPSSPAPGEAWPRTGAEHTRVFEHRKRRPNQARGRDRRAWLLKVLGMGPGQESRVASPRAYFVLTSA